MIYLDPPVALAWLLTEVRRLSTSFWDGTLVFSRLIEYEMWTPLHVTRSCGFARQGGAPAYQTGRAAGTAPAGFGSGTGGLSRHWAVAAPCCLASGVVRVSGRSRPGHEARELRPADERCRPRHGHFALRSGRGINRVTGFFSIIRQAPPIPPCNS